MIKTTKGVRYGGLMTYPKAGTRRLNVAAFLDEAKALAAKAGLDTETRVDRRLARHVER